MRARTIVGGAAGAAIGIGASFGFDVWRTDVAVERAKEGVEQIAGCQSGLMPITVEELAAEDGHLAQRFKCGRNIVVMTLEGPDWKTTEGNTQKVANQSYFNYDDMAGVGIFGGMGVVFGAAVVISSKQRKGLNQ